MHYESIAKSSDRDPRQTFRVPSDMSNTSGAGVVGPMGSSSFNLPSVERALVEMEGTSGTRSSNPSRSTVRKRYLKEKYGVSRAIHFRLLLGVLHLHFLPMEPPRYTHIHDPRCHPTLQTLRVVQRRPSTRCYRTSLTVFSAPVIVVLSLPVPVPIPVPTLLSQVLSTAKIKPNALT